MIYQQLSFLEEPKEDRLERDFRDLYESFEKVRKGQYAKITGLTKEINDLKLDMELLKRNIVRP